MNSKVFVFLVVVLSLLIIISLVGLGHSIYKYNNAVNDMENTHLENGVFVNGEATQKPVQVTTASPTTAPTVAPTTTSSTKESSSDYILPSDKRLIEKSEISSFDYDKLNLAYNEIFARHGHDFKSANLKEYFSRQSWYKPVEGRTVSTTELSKIENDNLAIIKARIDEVKG